MVVLRFFNADTIAIPIVRELGFANISFGLIAMLSVVVESFRFPAAIAGGFYFGLDGIQHLLRLCIAISCSYLF